MTKEKTPPETEFTITIKVFNNRVEGCVDGTNSKGESTYAILGALEIYKHNILTTINK